MLVLLLTTLAAMASERRYTSPDGKYCLIYNEEQKQYYMHDNRMNYDYCITCEIPKDNFDDGILPVWRDDSRYVYISGIYDIWQIDITRAIAPLKISRRKNDAPVKYFMIYDGNTLHAGNYIYMITVNTVTGEGGRASFHQSGYAYRYRNYRL